MVKEIGLINHDGKTLKGFGWFRTGKVADFCGLGNK
jgi:hypothetical protein